MKRRTAAGRARPAWQQAVSVAARAHEHQKRNDGCTPYFAHPVRVALTVRDLFGCDDPVALCAALLHDTIEDTTVDYDEIRAQFGPQVASCVAALTKNAALPEKERERDYDRRLAGADWRARLVKLADTYDNLSDAREHAGGAKKSKVAKVLTKCRRAVKLAQPDIRAHEATRRAVLALRALMKQSR